MAENFFPEGTAVQIKVGNLRFPGKVLAYNYMLHRYRIEVMEHTEFELASYMKPEERFERIFNVSEADVELREASPQV
jgi:hypothetical protein